MRTATPKRASLIGSFLPAASRVKRGRPPVSARGRIGRYQRQWLKMASTQPELQPRHDAPQPPPPIATRLKPPLPFSLSKTWHVARLTSAISASPMSVDGVWCSTIA